LLTLSVFGSVFLKKLRFKFLNESIFAILCGMIGGFLFTQLNNIRYINSITQGYVKVFIIFLLPPIIFER
jgi:hypothetical protein